MKKIKIGESLYTEEEFVEKYGAEGEDIAASFLEMLLKSGQATIVDNEIQTKEDKAIHQALKEQEIIEKAEMFDEYDQKQKEFKMAQSRENRLLYEQIELDFAHLGKAEEMQNWIKSELALQTEIAIVNGFCVLRVFNLTDKDLNAINLRYTTDKAIGTVVSKVEDTANFATDAVHYTANKVVSPLAKATAKASANIFKTLAVTTAKTGGTLISSLTNGIKQSSKEIQNDPEVVRAIRDLTEVKNTAKKSISKIKNSNPTGIRIIK